MSELPDENRSWTEVQDPERALEELRDGLDRLKGNVATFRKQMQGADEDPDAR